jgi:hypothetical protein
MDGEDVGHLTIYVQLLWFEDDLNGVVVSNADF